MKTTVTRSQKKPAAPLPAGPTHAEIRARAEALWLERGCPHGTDDSIWLEAERQLRQGAKGAMGGLKREQFGSDRLMSELDDLYPSQSGRETTSL
jgi:hypothetical protein